MQFLVAQSDWPMDLLRPVDLNDIKFMWWHLVNINVIQMISEILLLSWKYSYWKNNEQSFSKSVPHIEWVSCFLANSTVCSLTPLCFLDIESPTWYNWRQSATLGNPIGLVWPWLWWHQVMSEHSSGYNMGSSYIGYYRVNPGKLNTSFTLQRHHMSFIASQITFDCMLNSLL